MPAQSVKYCNRTCQQLDWKNHKSVCTMQKSFKDFTGTSNAKAMKLLTDRAVHMYTKNACE